MNSSQAKPGKQDDSRAGSGVEKPGKQTHPALHLFWAVPVALIVGYPLWVVAAFSWCGISGCGGGGFGVDTTYAGVAIACAILAGVLLATVIAAVPWSRGWSRFFVTRLVIAVVIGAAYAIAGAILTH
ncbi:MAG: hypothetical protein QOF36_2198 [Microbacteriaceae bacterium]|jgi:hypothetical protein|nr:hypothetical protein [Microbacteriaceae bacterium]